jgi:aldehyde dehydrogenase (NAD+)
MPSAPERREPLFIDGSLPAARDGETFPNVNPATEGVTADGADTDMDRAIAAARRAFYQARWATSRQFLVHCQEA